MTIRTQFSLQLSVNQPSYQRLYFLYGTPVPFTQADVLHSVRTSPSFLEVVTVIFYVLLLCFLMPSQ